MHMQVTAGQCLATAREYIARAEATADDKLREQCLLMAKELTELAEKLDACSSEIA